MTAEVSALASGATAPAFDPVQAEKFFGSGRASVTSSADLMSIKYTIIKIGTLSGKQTV